jgi:amidase
MNATEVQELVAQRATSVVEVVRQSLARIEELDPKVNAICTLNPAALAEAEALDRRLASGEAARPLEGVPFVVKDNLPTRGLRTTYGTRIHKDNIPGEDAIAVARIRKAGGVLVGKTNLPEFAHDVNSANALFGLTRNPVDLNVTAGGSSGGTAAAIAAGMAPIGLGTDLGGSIRIPASFCGICGLRPSPGRVPAQSPDYAWDTLVAHVHGPMARTVADTGLLLSVIAGPDDRDPLSLPSAQADYARCARSDEGLQGRRAAYIGDLAGLVPINEQVGTLARQAALAFTRLGCELDERPLDASDLLEIIAGTRGFNMIARYHDLYDTRKLELSAQLTGQIEDGLSLDIRTLARAERLRTSYYHRVRQVLEEYDYILLPTVGVPAFRLDQPLPRSINGRPIARYYDALLGCYAVSVLGLPAMSIPCGTTREGLPVGLQIVGRRLREDRILEAASNYALLQPVHFEPRPIGSSPAREVLLTTTGLRSVASN